MNMKHILVAFILIISMISLGCVDKSSGDSSQKNVSTEEQIQVTPTSNEESNSDISGNEPVSEGESAITDDNGSISENDDANVVDNESVPTDSEPTSEVVNDTSITETFKIGEDPLDPEVLANSATVARKPAPPR